MKDTPRRRESEPRTRDAPWGCNKHDFKGMVRANMIPNCPIDVNDIANARDIWGPDLASIRGKMVTTNTSTSGDRVRGSAKVND